jgi:hypothetical protein
MDSGQHNVNETAIVFIRIGRAVHLCVWSHKFCCMANTSLVTGDISICDTALYFSSRYPKRNPYEQVFVVFQAAFSRLPKVFELYSNFDTIVKNMEFQQSS